MVSPPHPPINLAYFAKNDNWVPESELSYKISDLLDTLLINCDLISSQSMLIYSLKLKLTLSRKQLIESQKMRYCWPKGA